MSWYESHHFGRSPLGLLFGLYPRQPLSAAGRLLEKLNEAEQAVEDADDITDELRCALRWIQKPLVKP